jgi:hypothetical protein
MISAIPFLRLRCMHVNDFALAIVVVRPFEETPTVVNGTIQIEPRIFTQNMLDAKNPYSAPACEAPSLAAQSYSRQPGVRATLISAKLLYRKIVVEAPVEAVIEYCAYEMWDRIIVDGLQRARKFCWVGFAKDFEFVLPSAPAPIPVRIDVRIGPLLRVRWLRVEIDGQAVYEEGRPEEHPFIRLWQWAARRTAAKAPRLAQPSSRPLAATADSAPRADARA